jgi:hypothetical protein
MKEELPRMDTSSAGNAVMHGLSGLRHMPKGREAELGSIERDLIGSRLPETPEQLEIVRELAFAMWQKGEHERVMYHQAEKLALKAGDLFDQKALEDYQNLRELWFDQPLDHTKAMAKSKLGVEYFVESWNMISQSLKDGFGITLPMAYRAIKTEGCSISPLMISGDGIWILTRALAQKPSLTEIVEEWLDMKDFRQSEDAVSRANEIFKKIPNSQESSQDLQERATSRIKHWSELHQKLSVQYDQERQDYIDQYSVNVMSSEEFEKQLHRMHRYRVFTENRIKELNRRLANIKSDMLKKERLADEKEFRRQNHEIAVAQMQRNQFEQLIEYRNHLENDRKPANLEPPRNVLLTAEDVEKIPPDWQTHTDILPNAIPNAELFTLWSDEQLIESSQMIEYLMHQPSTNKHWLEQITACQEYELQLRSLTLRSRE